MFANLLSVVMAMLIVSDVTVSRSEGHKVKRSDDGDPLQTVVDNLAQQLSQQASSFNSRLDALTAEIAQLKDKTDSLDQTVAFYAWNTQYPITTTAQGTLILDHAITNIGHAYSALTGVFTAPRTGVYYFQTTFLGTHLGPGQAVHAAIYVDSQMVAKGISDTNHGGYDQTTISAIVQLSSGQHVYVKNPDSVPYDYHGSLQDPHTTFSGFLMHAE